MSDTDAGPTPAEAFAALASPIRIRIIRTLGETAADDPAAITFLPFDHPDRGLAYSALRERVDIADSGRFNYHLGELIGSFVEKEGDRYRLTWLGALAYRFLVAGRFSASPVARRFDLDDPCHRCGGRVEARYTADQLLYVDCTDCGLRTMMIHVPQHGVAGRSREALLSAGAMRYRTHVQSLTAGICPWCSGRIETAVGEADDETRGQPVATHLCRDCGGVYFPSVGAALLSHPAVVAFCHARGVDLRDHYPWTVPFAFAPAHATVTSRDPLRVRIDVRLAGDRCRVVVDDRLTVRSVVVATNVEEGGESGGEQEDGNRRELDGDGPGGDGPDGDETGAGNESGVWDG
jgi:DNA-directed RNA polymerase subunit RPC12/RpoP